MPGLRRLKGQRCGPNSHPSAEVAWEERCPAGKAGDVEIWGRGVRCSRRAQTEILTSQQSPSRGLEGGQRTARGDLGATTAAACGFDRRLCLWREVGSALLSGPDLALACGQGGPSWCARFIAGCPHSLRDLLTATGNRQRRCPVPSVLLPAAPPSGHSWPLGFPAPRRTLPPHGAASAAGSRSRPDRTRSRAPAPTVPQPHPERTDAPNNRPPATRALYGTIQTTP